MKRKYQSINFNDGTEVYLFPRELECSHLENCKVLPSRYEMMKLFPRGGSVAEVGVQAGVNARFIMETCQPDQLHLFDGSFSQERFPFDYDYFNPLITEGRVILHQGDSATLLAKLPDHSLDWIYIDGDHSFEGVNRDIDQAKRKVKPQGLFAFNDYTPYSHLERIQYGVQRAVNDFMLDENLEAVYFAFSTIGYPDICLKRKNVQ